MKVKNFILIVDDIPKNLQVLGSILYDNNYEIAMADSGMEALKMLENITPDLILLDVMMPIMDGFEVCIKIKSNPRLSEIPIIFLTAKNEIDNIVKAFKCGAADYVTKPFNSEELLSRVKFHIELKKSKEKLLELNNHLEQKINERTAQLKIALDKLAKLDNAKSYFLGLLSHELNTPLTGIMGSIDLLKDSIKNKDERELLDLIANSTLRLKKFADEAMLIMRLRTDKYEMQLYDEDICKIIEEIIYYNQDIIGQKNITVKKIIPKDEIFIKLDYALAKKCFEIIIDNAIKYTPVDGSIIIDLKEKNGYVVVNINNSGDGFTQETLNNAFNLFFSDEIMHHSKGYGLGLATAELIMNAHSGEIKICNNELGANVELKFPL